MYNLNQQGCGKEDNMTRVNKEDLVTIATAKGYRQVSTRLVDDWVAKGLLDRPEHRPLGYGRGSKPAVWSDNQRELFLSLLEKRDEGMPIPALCNIPIWLWLWWGDSYVPLRQVRRAMQTWAKAAGYPPAGRARTDMRRLMGEWGDPGARRRDRRELEAALYPMVCSGRIDEATLLPLVQKVFDPKGTGVSRGPVGGQVTPEGYVRLLHARVQAITHLNGYGDQPFEQARVAYLATRHRYERVRPRLAADPELGERFAEQDLSELVMDACLDLATLLGLAIMTPARIGTVT